MLERGIDPELTTENLEHPHTGISSKNERKKKETRKMAYPQNKPKKQFQMIGTINQVTPIETFPSKTGGMPFTKRTLVINDELQNEVAFEATMNSAASLDSFQPGTQVSVTYNIDSRYWAQGNKWFTSLKVVSVVPQGGAQIAPQQPVAQPAQVNTQPAQVNYQMPQQAAPQPAVAQPAQPAAPAPATEPPAGDSDIPF